MVPSSAARLRAIASRLSPTPARLDGPGVPAAVLTAVIVGEDDHLHTVLTARRPDLRVHAGELAFPGGRAEPQDHDLTATALREAHEEIGLDPAGVEVLGALTPVQTRVTHFEVLPVVGLVPAGQRWRAQASEVADVHEWPLRALRDSHHHRTLQTPDGRRVSTDAYALGDAVVWGATARILRELLDVLGPLLDAEPPT